MISLFSAIEIPQLVASQLTALQQSGARAWDAGWVAPENFHVTLAYFGPVEEPMAEDIDGELRRIHANGFDMELSGVGAFGTKQPHALFAAVGKNPALMALAAKHLSVVRRFGLPVGKGGYVPHVTLARPRHSLPEQVQGWIAANNLYASGPVPVERTVLFSSHKTGEGRHYEAERFYPLGPALIPAQGMTS